MTNWSIKFKNELIFISSLYFLYEVQVRVIQYQYPCIIYDNFYLCIERIMISSSFASSFLSPLLCASNQVEVGKIESYMVCY